MSRQYNLDRFDRFFTSYLYNATGVLALGSVLTDRAGQGAKTIEARRPATVRVRLRASLQYEDWRVGEASPTPCPFRSRHAIAILTRWSWASLRRGRRGQTQLVRRSRHSPGARGHQPRA